MSAARPAYGVAGVIVDERPTAPSVVLPLLALVIALASAAVWFIALPSLTDEPPARRACEVFVLKSGSTKCVPEPTLGSRAAPQKSPRTAKR